MVDSVSPERRSAIMAAIKGRDTKPELAVKRALWSMGFRYGRSRRRRLPGSPDLVFPSLKAVVFVHGCFWHGHQCPLARVPKINTAFWLQKIETNGARDRRVSRHLRRQGWHVLTVWECSLETGVRRVVAALTRLRAARNSHRNASV